MLLEDEEDVQVKEKSTENTHNVFDENGGRDGGVQFQLTRKCSESTICSEATEGEDYRVKTSENYSTVSYGFIPRSSYEHHKNHTDLMGVCFNTRTRQFVLLDSKGIVTWSKDALDQKVHREMLFPKFEYNLFTSLVYARKYNVYFVLTKDFSLKVLNRDFVETCHVTADLRSVLFMIFNPIKDELITGGVGGTKVWRYHQVATQSWKEIKPMANYKLTLKYELPNVGGSWVKRVDLELHLQHLYCCSDTDLLAYDMEGKQVLELKRAHAMSITGCVYSVSARVLITISVDTEVKVWSLTGGLISTFRGHSRAISNVLVHPEDASLVVTSSLDGSVRVWSLDTMDCVYSSVISTDGLLWMGLTSDNLLYLSTLRNITLWSLNNAVSFWGVTRNKVLKLKLVHGEGKSTRIVSVGQDNSVRIFSRSLKKNLSTVLPPPSLSPMQQIKCVAYNRVYSIVYLLIDMREVWVYTTRTDPACRIAVWDVIQIQEELMLAFHNSPEGAQSRTSLFNKGPTHKATANGNGNEGISTCHCVCYLNSTAMHWSDEGFVCPIVHNYLLFGLEDGRVLFMDPLVKKKKYFEFKANKDPIVDIKHDPVHKVLMTCSHVGDAVWIQLWSLPTLDHLHDVYAPPDITGFVRLNNCLVTGHQNGAVIFHELVPPNENLSAYRPRFSVSDDFSEGAGYDMGRVEHAGPITGLDVCHKLGIVASCSPDGAVRIWQDSKVLLSEITLEDSLSTCSFLSNKGDLVLGFRNHIFYIDGSRVCPSLQIKEDKNSDLDETESEIYEDPAVLYEGVVENPDPICLENYLVPFDMDFSDDFISGQKKLSELIKVDSEPQVQDIMESDDEDAISAAPTDTYWSPFDTPRRLSTVDLTLNAEPTRYDLKGQIQKSLNSFFQDNDDADLEMLGFEFPKFGISPGPSPTGSDFSNITPSDFDVSDGGESTPVDTADERDFEPIEKPPESTPVEIEKPQVKKRPTMAEQLASIKIDSSKLMNETKKVEKPVPKPTFQRKVAEDSAKEQVKKRQVAKKEFKGERRKPKRGEKKPKREESPPPEPEQKRIVKPSRSVKKIESSEIGMADNRVKFLEGKGLPRTASPFGKSASPDMFSRHSDGFDPDIDGRIRSAGRRSKSPFDRSVSPSIYSDYGSEWTVPAPDEVLGRLTEIDEEEDRVRFMVAVKDAYGKDFAQAVTSGHSSLVAMDAVRTGKLQTAVDFPQRTEELEFLFQETLKHYLGNPRAADYIDSLYKRDGNKFDEQYHEKLIERHYLLRMQKQLRTQSASQKRKQLNYERRERIKTKIHHEMCETPRMPSSRYPDRQAMKNLHSLQRAQTAPPMNYPRLGSATYTKPQRPHTAGIKLLKEGEERCESRAQMVFNKSRPNTAVSTRTGLSSKSRPGTAATMRSNLRSRPNTAVSYMSRPTTGYGSYIEEDMVDISDKRELGADTPYRGRINRELPSYTRKARSDKHELMKIDPRCPLSIYSRPQSSKSIPSKCSRYVLIQQAKGDGDEIVPTFIEEKLIAERFPEWTDRWLANAPQTTTHIIRNTVPVLENHPPLVS